MAGFEDVEDDPVEMLWVFVRKQLRAEGHGSMADKMVRGGSFKLAPFVPSYIHTVPWTSRELESCAVATVRNLLAAKKR